MKYNDIQFIAYPMSRLYPGTPLPGDLYLFLNGDFLRFKSESDEITAEKYELFMYKKLQYFFINLDDMEKYSFWSAKMEGSAKNELLKSAGAENKDLIEEHLQIKDEILSFVTKEVTDKSIKEILSKTKNFIQLVQEKVEVTQFIGQMISYSQSVADHGTNVANLSTFFAMSLGYKKHTMLEAIYLGALLHDYGKTKISQKFLEQPFSPNYIKAMKKHPSLGKTSLLLDSGFSDDVLRIISEHHERHDGKGYPKGLRGQNIYELTKIVSIANVFDNLVMKLPGSIPDRQRSAIKTIAKEGGRAFDAAILLDCIQALEKTIP